MTMKRKAIWAWSLKDYSVVEVDDRRGGRHEIDRLGRTIRRKDYQILKTAGAGGHEIGQAMWPPLKLGYMCMHAACSGEHSVGVSTPLHLTMSYHFFIASK